MRTNKKIEEFFSSVDAESSFGDSDLLRFQIGNLPTDCHTLVYCPKMSILHELIREDLKRIGIGIVGIQGLPFGLRTYATSQKRVFFIGDFDPTDLLIFKWLEGTWQSLEYLGIGGELLDELTPMNWHGLQIQLSEFEINALNSSFDWDWISGNVGVTHFDFYWSKGYKIELDWFVRNRASALVISNYIIQRCLKK